MKNNQKFFHQSHWYVEMANTSQKTW